jgi:hypothetical protein
VDLSADCAQQCDKQDRRLIQVCGFFFGEGVGLEGVFDLRNCQFDDGGIVYAVVHLAWGAALSGSFPHAMKAGRCGEKRLLDPLSCLYR